MLGSDLGVNNYGLNFKVPLSSGTKVVNKNVHRANLLVMHVFKDLSISPGKLCNQLPAASHPEPHEAGVVAPTLRAAHCSCAGYTTILM